VTDPLIAAAQFLVTQLPWLAHATDEHGGPYAASVFAEIRDCASRMRSLVDGPQAGRYAGPCSTQTPDGTMCGQDVIARAGAAYGTCKACGSRYDVDEQQAWMREEIEGYLARPVKIAGILLRLGSPIGYSTIASYAAKGQLISHGIDDKGKPLYRIGDVIDLRMGARRQAEHG
jgi:hypothetical protein